MAHPQPNPSHAAPLSTAARSEADTQSLIVVIDHASAHVYRIDLFADDADGVTAHDTRQLVHHLERKRHDKDREETYPADTHFFEAVSAAVSTGGYIVIIGHGKGQSNEAAHFTAYLKRHNPETYQRIVREIVADLPSLTTPERLKLGRDALLKG